MHPDQQQGFTLLEVLIAAGIAAAASSVLALSVSTVSRSYARTQMFQAELTEAENILAEIEAGVSISNIRISYPKWTVLQEPIETDRARPISRLEKITVTHLNVRRMGFTTLRLTDTETPR